MSFRELFEGQAADYGDSLVQFKADKNLPSILFDQPDHIAYKAANGAEFELLLREFQSIYDCKEVSWTEKGDRVLAVAELLGHRILFGMWAVNYVELMEPRPEKVGNDLWGIDHAEFYTPNIKTTHDALHHYGIDGEYIPDESHPRLEIVINDEGQEVKFTSKRIYSVVEKGVQQGNTFMVPPR